MSKTVFILGAGASYKAGVPLMNDFLDRARSLGRLNGLSDEDKNHFENVFSGISSLQRIHSKAQLDTNNLESVFATFEMANRLKKMPGFKDEDIPNLISSLKRLIVVTIERSLKFPLSNNGTLKIPRPYDKFASLLEKAKTKAIPSQDISILTFNYDLAIDFLLFKHNMGPIYSLENSSNGRPDWIKLLKLHGSLNWGITEDKERVRPWELTEFFSNRRYMRNLKNGLLTPGSDLKNYEGSFKYKHDPVIIPPTWNKSTFHPDIKEVWIEAAKQLEEAENLFVIGFSLPETDIFFKHLYGLGTTGDIPFNKFWVFDPDKKGLVRKRYENLLGPGARSRFKFYEKTFEEAIGIIQNSFDYRN